MSPVGYQFLLHLAPRIDKVLIPPDKRPAELDRNRQGGAGHDDGCEVGVAAHPSADIDQRLRRAARDRVQLRRPQHPAWSANLLAHPECAVEFMAPTAQYRAELLSWRRPRRGMGHGYRLLRRLRALPGQLRTARDQGLRLRPAV